MKEKQEKFCLDLMNFMQDWISSALKVNSTSLDESDDLEIIKSGFEVTRTQKIDSSLGKCPDLRLDEMEEFHDYLTEMKKDETYLDAEENGYESEEARELLRNDNLLPKKKLRL